MIPPLTNASLGSCMSCVSDIALGQPLAAGRRCVAEAVARRLQTPRGGLIDDANYGFDLAGLVNNDLDVAMIASLQSSVEAECLKDERILDATATILLTAGVLICTVQLYDNVGPFSLVLSVSDLELQILQVTS